MSNLNKKPKPVEYKDTFDFRVFPEYQYTILQNKRFNLFQGRIEHYKKIINYADKFDMPNKINLVYMIGYSEKLKPYVEKTNSNIVVLAANISLDILNIYDKFWSMVKSLIPARLVDDDGNFTDIFFEDIKIAHQYYEEHKTDEANNKRIAQYEDYKKLAEEYEKACIEINKAYKRYIIIDKLHPEKTIDHKDLDKIIKRYFPFGREQCGVSDKVLKSVVKVKTATQYGLAQDLENGYKLLGIPDDPKKRELLRKNIKRCDMDINTELRAHGHANLYAIYLELKKPPYGWDCEAHAAFCIGYAISLHKDNHWIWKSNTVPVMQYAETFIDAILKDERRVLKHYGSEYGITMFDEDGWRLANRFALIFGIEAKTPVISMILPTLFKAIMKHTRIPVSVIDEKLMEVFNNFECTIDTDSVNAIIKYFDWDKCKEIHEKYLTINEDTFRYLKEKYPTATEQDLFFCTTDCSGWLWSRDVFYNSVETYFNPEHVPTGFRNHDRKVRWYCDNCDIPYCKECCQECQKVSNQIKMKLGKI